MRTDWRKIVMALCLITVVTGWGKIGAGEMAKEEQVSAQPPALPGGPMMEPASDQVDKVLAEMKKTNPQKAEELIQLREKDPNAFKMEFHKAMREHFMARMREQGAEPGKWQQGGPDGLKAGSPGPGPQGQQWMGHGGPEMMREWMKEKHEEYIKWLEKNYPDEATKLQQLKDENPEQYMRGVMVSGRKYAPIFFASRDNPQLAAVLKEQLALKEKRMDMVKQINATTDEKKKKELTGQLETVVGQQFDLIVKKKQLAYEDLTKKLAGLQKEVENKKAEVEKWKGKDFKNQQVKQRVNELLSEKEKFEWE